MKDGFSIEPAVVTDIGYLALIINAGVSLMRCIHTLGEDSESDQTRRMAIHVFDSLDKGNTLTRSLSGIPGQNDWKNPYLIALTRAGEIGGVLDETLERAAVTLRGFCQLEKACLVAGVEETVPMLHFRWFGQFRALVASRVPLLSTLGILIDDPCLERLRLDTEKAKELAKNGDHFYAGLSSFPARFRLILEIGEETGSLDSMTQKIADSLRAEVFEGI